MIAKTDSKREEMPSFFDKGGNSCMQPIEDRTTLSQRLRLLRVASGMKQEDVAVQLGIGRSAYTYYELSRSKPDYDTLIQLAKMFHVSVDYLVGFSNFPDGSHREAGVADGSQESNIVNVRLLGELTKKERRMVFTYRQLAPEQQEEIVQEMEKMLPPKK